MANILIKMAEIKDLSPSERHVVEYVLENYKDVANMGIVELGEKTFTSTTTVKRFCRKLGVDSYTDFRVLLSAAQDDFSNRSTMNISFAQDKRYSTISEVLEKVSKQNAQSILKTSKIVDSDEFVAVVEQMAAAKRIDFYGVGPSNVVARDAQIKCRRLKIQSSAPSDRVSMLVNAQANTAGALAFLISYTGETDDVVEVGHTLKRLRVPTVALTSSTGNSVASMSDYKLRVDSSESWDRLGGMSSRISTLSVIDALFTALLNTDYERYVMNMVDTCVNNRVKAERKD